MTRPTGNNRDELVDEFYANYAPILKNLRSTRKEKYMRKKQRLDTLIVRGMKIDISKKTISKVLFGDVFEMLRLWN